MGAHHDHHEHGNIESAGPGYKRVLWVVMVVNLGMFIIEIFSGFLSGSAALLADSLDFAGDAATYGISIFVIGSHLHTRARASLLKSAAMAVFGFWVIGTVVYHLINGSQPQSETMGVVGVLALVANLFSAYLLYRFREGDSNMLSVWLCTRNDAIGNVAVLLAALGVYMSGSNIPDLIVALGMGALGIAGAMKIFRKARVELAHKH